MGLGTWFVRLAIGGGSLVGVAVAALYFFQEKLLYVPRLPGVPDDYNIPPERYGLDAEDVAIETKDHVRLHAWLIKLKQWSPDFISSRPVILFFQENAGNMSFRLPFLKRMAHRLECPILAVSYRGYGMSAGTPNESGLKLDAQAALELLSTRRDLNHKQVVVYGRSLGGAVAIHLTADNLDKIAALIVENTFTSVEDMVSRVVPPLGTVVGTGKPFNFLVTNKWHNNRHIQLINNVPLLMVISEQDEMVPPSQMLQLYQLQKASTCKVLTVPGARHMDAYDVAPDLYWGNLRSFLDEHVRPS